MKRYHVTLTDEERTHVREWLAKGKAPARTLTHARILLKADRSEAAPGWTDETIGEALEVSLRTIERVRQRFVEEGLDAALHPKVSLEARRRKLDGEQEAHLIALACSPPPSGRNRWTLRLLADRMVELDHVDCLSYETVRQTLKKTNCSHG